MYAMLKPGGRWAWSNTAFLKVLKARGRRAAVKTQVRRLAKAAGFKLASSETTQTQGHHRSPGGRVTLPDHEPGSDRPSMPRSAKGLHDAEIVAAQVNPDLTPNLARRPSSTDEKS